MINVGLDSLESPYTCSLCEKVFPSSARLVCPISVSEEEEKLLEKVRNEGRGDLTSDRGTLFPPA